MAVEPPEKPTQASTSSYDPHALLHPQVDRSWRRLPRLIGQAFALVWDADRADVIVVAVLQALGGVLLVAQLLVIRGILGEVLAAGRSDVAELTVGAIAPDLLVLAVISGLSVLASAAGPERQRVLAERVNRAAVGRVIDATTAVPLETFESPEFHDHLARAHTNAQMRPFALVQGVLSLGSGLVGMAAVTVASRPKRAPVASS